jgi:hypothetical protein
MTTSEALKLYEEKAAPICGWPEWLGYADTAIRTSWDISGVWIENMQHKQALCLWREHVREWLDEKNISLCRDIELMSIEPYRKWIVVADRLTEQAIDHRYFLAKKSFEPFSDLSRRFDDIDSAYIAAVEAIGKGKK